jgi:hypothetical protein
VVPPGDVGEVHPDLAVLQLPEPAAPLPLNPDGGRALLGEGRRIEHQHGVRFAQLRPDLPGQLGQERAVVPVGLADELLEPLPLPVVEVRDRLGGLAPEVGHQAPDVVGGVLALRVRAEGRGERSDEPLQAWDQAPQQARVDLGIAEQLVQPDAEPTLHRATPLGGWHPLRGFVPNALRPIRRGIQ